MVIRNNLLLQESPELVFACGVVVGTGILTGGWVGLALIVIGVIALCFFIYFYRWEPCEVRVSDKYILSPCEG